MTEKELIAILVEALPPPEKLTLLALWIDAKYPGDTEPQVQRDLRTWALKINHALEEYIKHVLPK